jgi:hypothetical protein
MEARQAAFLSEMEAWRDAKQSADTMAAMARNAASSYSTFGASNFATPFEAMSLELQNKMESANAKNAEFIRQFTANQEIRECYAEAAKIKATFDVQKGQIIRRATDLAAARQEFDRLVSEVQRAYAEGSAAVGHEARNRAPTFSHSYWYSEKADAYLREFEWAKRLVYLAMRAVEYEFQGSLGLRTSILTASYPDQLEQALLELKREVATRAINRRRPEEASVVWSLRDELLGIADMSGSPDSGERNFTPVQTFRERLWDKKFSIYDKNGVWVGQGLPFTVAPQGALLDRCAERVWRVTATIQGDGLSEKQPGAAIKVLKRNTFTSQWCEGRKPQNSNEAMQIGHLQPSRNLFRDLSDDVPAGETEAYSTAAVYPWFNVRRSDFYKVSYRDGASEELAGRGLYGDYILLFPAELLEGEAATNPAGSGLQANRRSNKFPLDRVEDVLIRFDYLSVDNFAARGLQVSE